MKHQPNVPRCRFNYVQVDARWNMKPRRGQSSMRTIYSDSSLASSSTSLCHFCLLAALKKNRWNRPGVPDASRHSDVARDGRHGKDGWYESCLFREKEYPAVMGKIFTLSRNDCTRWKEKFVRGYRRWILQLRFDGDTCKELAVKLIPTLNFKIKIFLYSTHRTKQPNSYLERWQKRFLII